MESNGVELFAHRLRLQVGEVGEGRKGRSDKGHVGGMIDGGRCEMYNQRRSFGLTGRTYAGATSSKKGLTLAARRSPLASTASSSSRCSRRSSIHWS